jgi:hypothetical protein
MESTARSLPTRIMRTGRYNGALQSVLRGCSFHAEDGLCVTAAMITGGPIGGLPALRMALKSIRWGALVVPTDNQQGLINLHPPARPQGPRRRGDRGDSIGRLTLSGLLHWFVVTAGVCALAAIWPLLRHRNYMSRPWPQLGDGRCHIDSITLAANAADYSERILPER